jgi:hypothetical protein
LNKFKKSLNYALALVGTALLVTAIYKTDVTISLLGLIVLDNSLSALSLDKNEEKIKELEKTINELKGK